MKRRAFVLGITMAGVLAGAAFAEAEPEEIEVVDPLYAEDVHEAPLGTRTRAWLERQRNGSDSSRSPHGLTPPAEHRTRSRYLDSYTHPIPEFFDLEAAGSFKK